jgi:hypothetical protein
MRVSYGAVRFTCSVFARDGIADPASPLSFETCWTYDTDAMPSPQVSRPTALSRQRLTSVSNEAGN